MKILGLTVDGGKSTVCPTPEKLHGLLPDTVRFCRYECVRGVDVSELVGRWLWWLLLSRPSLSLLRSAYRFAAVAGTRRYTLWNSVRRELLNLVVISPLLRASLTRQVSSSIYAVDACLSAGAVVRLDCGVSVAQRVAALTPHPHVFPPTLPTCLQDCLESPRKTLFTHAWRSPAHINALELWSLILAVERHLSSLSPAMRLSVLSDNAVVCAAVAKGRSSSDLLPLMRRLSALVLSCGLALSPVWIPSALNPADAPSRSLA